MTYSFQLAANRQNARKGGPKTEDGKRRSRLNALRHGVTAQTTVLPDEDPDAFRAFAEARAATLQPRNEIESDFVESYVISSWQLKRCLRAHTGLVCHQMQHAEAQTAMLENEESGAEYRAEGAAFEAGTAKVDGETITDPPASNMTELDGARWLDCAGATPPDAIPAECASLQGEPTMICDGHDGPCDGTQSDAAQCDETTGHEPRQTTDEEPFSRNEPRSLCNDSEGTGDGAEAGEPAAASYGGEIAGAGPETEHSRAPP